jgi:hypothetical protein
MIYRIPLTSLPANAGDTGQTFIVAVELKANSPVAIHKEPKEWGFGPGIPVDFGDA